MFRWIRWVLADGNLETAVRRRDLPGVIQALGNGADPNLVLRHMEALPLSSTAIPGAWTIVRGGTILACAMDLGFDEIGLALADAGATVDPTYQDRIVAQRWQHRLETTWGHK